MGSKLDQDLSPDFFFQEDPTSSIYAILLTNKWTNGHENNTILAEVIITPITPVWYLFWRLGHWARLLGYILYNSVLSFHTIKISFGTIKISYSISYKEIKNF